MKLKTLAHVTLGAPPGPWYAYACQATRTPTTELRGSSGAHVQSDLGEASNRTPPFATHLSEVQDLFPWCA